MLIPILRTFAYYSVCHWLRAPPVQMKRVSNVQTQCSQLNQSWGKSIEAIHLAVRTGVVRLKVEDFLLASQIQGLFLLRLENAKRKSLACCDSHFESFARSSYFVG